MGVTMRRWLLAVVAVWICSGSVECVDMQGIALVGGTGEYLEVSQGTYYQLQCLYRAGYDDMVEKIVWMFYGQPVYTWIQGRSIISVSAPLLGHVDSRPDAEPEYLHFTKVTHDLIGNYTCEVTSSKGVQRSKPFRLQVVDISSAYFETHVNLMSDEVKEGYMVANADEDKNCTLIWDFKSPAIYPRPNVTCGYYSYDHDEITTHLPAGLALNQLMNGSWQAVFDHTLVKVKDIPVHGRLGCSVKIPETTYRKLIKFDNDLVIDSKIDATGCPAPELSRNQNLQYRIQDATVTCRGDLVPSTREKPVKILIKCPDYYTAIFPNGTAEWGWRTVAACSYQEVTWRKSTWVDMDPDKMLGDVISFTDLPYCVRGYSGSSCSMLNWNLFIILLLTSLRSFAL